MSMRALLLTGEFSDEELKELLATVRQIERRHTEVQYQFHMIKPDLAHNSIHENTELMRLIFPCRTKTPEGAPDAIEVMRKIFPVVPDESPPRFFSKSDIAEEWEEHG